MRDRRAGHRSRQPSTASIAYSERHQLRLAILTRSPIESKPSQRMRSGDCFSEFRAVVKTLPTGAGRPRIRSHHMSPCEERVTHATLCKEAASSRFARQRKLEVQSPECRVSDIINSGEFVELESREQCSERCEYDCILVVTTVRRVLKLFWCLL